METRESMEESGGEEGGGGEEEEEEEEEGREEERIVWMRSDLFPEVSSPMEILICLRSCKVSLR